MKLENNILYPPVLNEVIIDSNRIGPYVKEVYDNLLGVDSRLESWSNPHGISLGRKIIIAICSSEKFEATYSSICGDMPQNSLLGFVWRSNTAGHGSIYIRRSYFPTVMKVIGHEIGHLLGSCLSDPRLEEAKAYAFETAWTDEICDKNTGNLRSRIQMNLFSPRLQDPHKTAINFVFKKIQAGVRALDLFRDISKGKVRIEEEEK